MKRFLSAALCAVLVSGVMSLGITANAKELNSDTVGNANGDSNMSVAAVAIPAPTYTVTIPEKVEFGSVQRSQTDNYVTVPCEVTASGVSNLFANDKTLDVSISSKNGYKISDGVATPNLIPYKLYSVYTDAEKTEIADGKILSLAGTSDNDKDLAKTINGSVVLNTKNIVKAGSYSDVLTFNVALTEVNH